MRGIKTPKELRGGCKVTVTFFFLSITTLLTNDSISNFLSPKSKSSVNTLTKSFKYRGLQKYFETGNKSGINPEHALKLARILNRLDVAVQPLDMNLPSYKLHQLSGLSLIWRKKE